MDETGDVRRKAESRDDCQETNVKHSFVGHVDERKKANHCPYRMYDYINIFDGHESLHNSVQSEGVNHENGIPGS